MLWGKLVDHLSAPPAPKSRKATVSVMCWFVILRISYIDIFVIGASRLFHNMYNHCRIYLRIRKYPKYNFLWYLVFCNEDVHAITIKSAHQRRLIWKRNQLFLIVIGLLLWFASSDVTSAWVLVCKIQC